MSTRRLLTTVAIIDGIAAVLILAGVPLPAITLAGLLAAAAIIMVGQR